MKSSSINGLMLICPLHPVANSFMIQSVAEYGACYAEDTKVFLINLVRMEYPSLSFLDRFTLSDIVKVKPVCFLVSFD